MQNVGFADFFSAKKILVIKSVRDAAFATFMETVRASGGGDFVYLCERADVLFFGRQGVSESSLLFHSGKIGKNDIMSIPPECIAAVSKVCFCNYGDFRPAYTNVEEFCLEFQRRNKTVSVYSFNVSKNTLNRYVSVGVHCEGVKLLSGLLSWAAVGGEVAV